MVVSVLLLQRLTDLDVFVVALGSSDVGDLLQLVLGQNELQDEGVLPDAVIELAVHLWVQPDLLLTVDLLRRLHLHFFGWARRRGWLGGRNACFDLSYNWLRDLYFLNDDWGFWRLFWGSFNSWLNNTAFRLFLFIGHFNRLRLHFDLLFWLLLLLRVLWLLLHISLRYLRLNLLGLLYFLHFLHFFYLLHFLHFLDLFYLFYLFRLFYLFYKLDDGLDWLFVFDRGNLFFLFVKHFLFFEGLIGLFFLELLFLRLIVATFLLLFLPVLLRPAFLAISLTQFIGSFNDFIVDILRKASSRKLYFSRRGRSLLGVCLCCCCGDVFSPFLE
jgi:hypothetical protein